MKIHETDTDEVIAEKEKEIRERVFHQAGFLLSPGVCPCDSNVVLDSGFRYSRYKDGKKEVPVIIIAVSYDLLFDLFYDLAVYIFSNRDRSSFVSAGLRTYHKPHTISSPLEVSRERIDLSVFLSKLCDFEKLIVDDGFTSASIVSAALKLDLQIDDHKLVVVYSDKGNQLVKIADWLKRRGVKEIPCLRTVADNEHSHNSKDEYRVLFANLAQQVGACDEDD